MKNIAACCVPVSPMKSEPSHKSEMISQLIFGERCETGPKDGHWIQVQSLVDGYKGWLPDTHLQMLEDDVALPELLTRDWVTPIQYAGQSMMIPMGSNLTGIKGGYLHWGSTEIRYAGTLYSPGQEGFSPDTIWSLTFTFLNTAYLWGGKSVFGTDCSGFTQTVFRFLGIHLARDTWQQAEQGRALSGLHESQCGDLAFFDSGQDRITHVGILLSPAEIIHASGIVRADGVDEKGIFQRDSGIQTHRLRCLRRMLP